MLDSRGYGQSEGPYATFGGREAGDIRAWLDLTLAAALRGSTRRLPFHPVLWGRSMGAAIALRAAAAEPRPRGVGARIAHGRPRRVDGHSCCGRRRIPFPKLMARLVTRRAGKLAGVPIHRPRPIDSARAGRLPHLDRPWNQ